MENKEHTSDATRRSFLGGVGAIGLSVASGPSWANDAIAEEVLPPKSPMGVATTANSAHMRGLDVIKPLRNDPIRYLEYCRSLGAGGVQTAVRTDLKRFRQRLEELDMFYEGEAALPFHPDDDLTAFEQSMLNAKELGANCVRAVSRPPKGGNRRYTTFMTMEDYRSWEAQANAVVEKVMPIVERIGVGLALENHKDRTSDEHLAILKKIDSEYLGALIDPGNNISLMEDPTETVTKLAPYAMATSLKDMGIAPYEKGFLLSEVRFGTGIKDQHELFSIMRKHNPKINPVQELITRDPLEIPILTTQYWETIPGYSGRDVAAMMERAAAYTTPLPKISHLSAAQHLKVEEDNNRDTFQWAMSRAF